LPGDVIDAFDEFNYSMPQQLWRFNHSDGYWKNMLKSEIDAGKPVFYYGGLSHYFVCDGYETVGSDDYFYFNWGWSGSFNSEKFTIDNLVNYNGDFTSTQSMIYGIYPDCGTLETSISNIDTVYANGMYHSQASNSITLPASGKTLTVQDTRLVLTAGNSITLGPGFWAKPGSNFLAETRQCGDHRVPFGTPGLKSAQFLYADYDTCKNKATSVDVPVASLISVAPNPTRDLVTVSNLPVSCIISVFDIFGKTCLTLSTKESNVKIDLSANIPGIYIIRVQYSNTFSNNKIIKL
jgi:hypothetical protein